MLFGGILPLLSDRSHRRVPFLVLAVIGATLGLIGITYATRSGWLLFSSFLFGFFLLSAGPLGFQYGAEITYPAPEWTSNGLLLLMGQASGIIFILALDAFKSPQTGSMTRPLLVLIASMVIVLLLSTRLKEAVTFKSD